MTPLAKKRTAIDLGITCVGATIALAGVLAGSFLVFAAGVAIVAFAVAPWPSER